MHARDTNETRTAAALNAIERDTFVRLERPSLVTGRSIPPREAVRAMLGALDFPASPSVLQIGAGVGYLSAVLGKMGGEVLAIEKSPSLAARAKAHAVENGLGNVTLRVGDGVAGAEDAGPFDLIIVATKAIKDYSLLMQQLKPDGQLLCLESDDSTQPPRLVKFTRRSSGFERSEHGRISLARDQYGIYINLGTADAGMLEQALQAARQKHVPVIDEIRRISHVNDLELYRDLARRCDLPLGDVDELLEDVDPVIFQSFSKAFLDHNHVVPLKISEHRLKLATSDPDVCIEEIRQVHPTCTIERILVTPTDLHRLWSALDLWSPDSTAAAESDRQEQDVKSGFLEPESHLVSVFEAIMIDAVAERASDIHFEQYDDHVRIRLRVDGDLHDLKHFILSPFELRGLVNIAKLRAELDISERRLPQGGRSRLCVGPAKFDLRIQVQPSLYGESVAIRLLPQDSTLIDISELGLSDSVSASYRRMLRNPAGMMLVVGPTGSGKSTTLYAGLQVLAQDRTRKVITVEDPIEYSIADIQQTQAHHNIGFGFADAMRAFVRLDPDVIMLGEIRDHETALEAVRASQTGHVLLSSLHANDAIDAIQRLHDLQIHSNSLASELTAIMAQRLAKRICPHCISPATPEPEILAELFPIDVPAGFVSFRGRGCPQCNGRGSRGRVAVIEFLHVNETVRNAIASRHTVGDLRRLALSQGLITMRQSALEHVQAGRIPLTELPRLLAADRMASEYAGTHTRSKRENNPADAAHRISRPGVEDLAAVQESISSQRSG